MKTKQTNPKTTSLRKKTKSLQLIIFFSMCLTLTVHAQNDMSNFNPAKPSLPLQLNLKADNDRLSTVTAKINNDSDKPVSQLVAPAKINSLVLNPTCAGVESPGNPYPCCDTATNAVSSTSGTGLGNCTFGAWYHAQRFWGVALPHWGNAGTWFASAQNASLPTSPTPALYSIGVSSTLSTYGHVAWVMEINNNSVLVYEQLCGSGSQGITQTWRPVSTFNKGFILSPANAPSPTLTQASYGPILHGPQTQTISFYQSNVNPGMRVVVIFPNGGRTTLKDGQLNLYGGILDTYVTLGTAGTYKFQVFNENGKYSGMTSVVVN
jgi:surface antigen